MAIMSAQKIADMLAAESSLGFGEWQTAVAVALAESSGNTTVFNGSCCYGLWQISLSAHYDSIPGNSRKEKIRYLRTPVGNMKMMEKILAGAGGDWGQDWSAYANGSYQKHWDKAGNAVANANPDSNWEVGIGPGGVELPGDISVPNPIKPITELAGILRAALGWITEPHNWLRIAAFVGGLLVLALAAIPLLRNTARAGRRMVR
jgi:Lysozyme like domain